MAERAAPQQAEVGGFRAVAARWLARAPSAPQPPSVSFAELVWAHHKRQEEVQTEDMPREGEWERRYRMLLECFKKEHGVVVDEYWCRGAASGAMLTEKPAPRRWTRLFRREQMLRLHAATDWRTAGAPHLAAYVYRWQTAAIKASEVLRGTSERIALHRIFTGTTRVLAFADAATPEDGKPWGELARFRAIQDAQLADVDAYYRSAGENQARIVYFHGMVWGTCVLAGAVGAALLVGWAIGWIDPRHEPTYTLFATIAMGAAGAILSVMTRMAKQDGFSLEFEVGRKSVRFLGGLRPWIGALFAVALYLALKSNLLELLPEVEDSVYFFATIAFLAGFSERRAKVLLDGTLGGALGPTTPQPPPASSPGPPPASAPR